MSDGVGTRWEESEALVIKVGRFRSIMNKNRYWSFASCENP